MFVPRPAVPRAWPLTLPALAAACGLLDPLDQPGLRVAMEPADTAVYVGASFQARAQMVNAYGDRYPSDHIRYGSLGPAVDVEPDGLVSGRAYGRVPIVGTRGHLADTGWVSVVPAGMLALSRPANPTTVEVTHVDGSGLRAVQTGFAPAWLPGDTSLVYHAVTPDGAVALFVTDLAGHNRMLVSPGRYPRAERDGSWVYYERQDAIWRVRADGSGIEQVTPGDDYQPDPSPDRRHLAFTSMRFGAFQLTVRDLAAGTERQLGVEAMWPRWHPTGDSIAYWSGDQNTGRGAIYVIAADGTGGYRASPEDRAYRPSGLDWSPDGQWLLARSDTTVDVIRVAVRTALPLGFATRHHQASWRW